MTQNGEHTWDLILTYHRCPKCGHIFESRDDYHLHQKAWVKGVACNQCGHSYEVTKAKKSMFPLIGTPQPPEFDWQ